MPSIAELLGNDTSENTELSVPEAPDVPYQVREHARRNPGVTRVVISRRIYERDCFDDDIEFVVSGGEAYIPEWDETESEDFGVTGYIKYDVNGGGKTVAKVTRHYNKKYPHEGSSSDIEYLNKYLVIDSNNKLKTEEEYFKWYLTR